MLSMRDCQFRRFATFFSHFLVLGLCGCGAAASSLDQRTYGSDGIHVVARQLASNGADAVVAAVAKSKGSAAAGAAASASSTPKPAATGSGGAAVQVGVRNFQQINQTMAYLTGEPASTPAIASAYLTLATALPTSNDVQGFVGSNQVAVFKLAVEYCNAVANDSTKASSVYGTLSMKAPLSTAFNAAAEAQLATSLINKFWGSNLATLPDQATSVSQVTSLIDNLVSGKTASSAAMTSAIATAACAAVLSAAPVTLF